MEDRRWRIEGGCGDGPSVMADGIIVEIQPGGGDAPPSCYRQPLSRSASRCREQPVDHIRGNGLDAFSGIECSGDVVFMGSRVERITG